MEPSRPLLLTPLQALLMVLTQVQADCLLLLLLRRRLLLQLLLVMQPMLLVVVDSPRCKLSAVGSNPQYTGRLVAAATYTACMTQHQHTTWLAISSNTHAIITG